MIYNIIFMTDYNKIKKKDLLNNINFFFYKQNKEINDIMSYKKKDLIKIMIDYNIEYIDEDKLKNLILYTEEINRLKTKILYNYYKYNNHSYTIKDIKNKNISELKEFIEEPKKDEFDELMNLIQTMLNYYKKYLNNTDKIIDINLPNLLELFSNKV